MEIFFCHLRLESAIAIPASNEEKSTFNPYAVGTVYMRFQANFKRNKLNSFVLW